MEIEKGKDGTIGFFCWENRYSPTIKVPPELFDSDGKIMESAGITIWSRWRERSLWAIHNRDDLQIGNTVVVPRMDGTLSGEVITGIEGNCAYADIHGWRHFFEFVKGWSGPPDVGKQVEFWAYLFSGNIAGIKKMELFSAECKGGEDGQG